MKPAKPVSAKRAKHRLQKREAILHAAQTALLASAINGPSIETIARLAGVSKVTIYNHFDGPDGVWSELMHEAVTAAQPHADAGINPEASLETTLIAIGEEFLSLQTNPLVQAARLAALILPNRCDGASSDLASATYGRFFSSLVFLFQDPANSGKLAISDAELAAEQFLALCASRSLPGSCHNLILLRGPQAISAQVASATRTFFRAFSWTSGVAAPF